MLLSSPLCSSLNCYIDIIAFFSIEFDKDGEYFVVAGVTKKIKVYEYSSVIEDTVGIHYPLVELQCMSKIRSVFI